MSSDLGGAPRTALEALTGGTISEEEHRLALHRTVATLHARLQQRLERFVQAATPREKPTPAPPITELQRSSRKHGPLPEPASKARGVKGSGRVNVGAVQARVSSHRAPGEASPPPSPVPPHPGRAAPGRPAPGAAARALAMQYGFSATVLHPGSPAAVPTVLRVAPARDVGAARLSMPDIPALLLNPPTPTADGHLSPTTVAVDSATAELAGAVDSQRLLLGALRLEAKGLGLSEAEIEAVIQGQPLAQHTAATPPSGTPKEQTPVERDGSGPLDRGRSESKTSFQKAADLGAERFRPGAKDRERRRRDSLARRAEEGLPVTEASAPGYLNVAARRGDLEALHNAVQSVQRSVGAAKHRVSSGVLNDLGDLLDDSEDLADRVENEMGAHRECVSFVNRHLKQELAAAQAAVDSASRRVGLLERQAAKSTQLLKFEGKGVDRPGSPLTPAPSLPPELGVEEEECVTQDAESQTQGGALADIERALQFFADLSSRENAVCDLFERMAVLADDIESQQSALEREMRCPVCGVFAHEHHCFWPCMHPLCSKCVQQSQNDRGQYVCPDCGDVTTDVPVTDVTATLIAARLSFKRVSTGELTSAISRLRRVIMDVDDEFENVAASAYRAVPDHVEYKPFDGHRLAHPSPPRNAL